MTARVGGITGASTSNHTVSRASREGEALLL
jgi:hypothetical protein